MTKEGIKLVKRAIISVYDKDGVVEFARELAGMDIQLVSTGGTHKLLKENGIDVISVEDVTHFPEIMDGRVKTLNPMIFGGILADRDKPSHMQQAEREKIFPIDLVVCSLYPFEETIAKEGVTEAEAIEQIDIGGVTLIRAAAKNFKHVNVITDKSQYAGYIGELKNTNNNIGVDYSRKLAYEAFEIITNYDDAIADYFYEMSGEDDEDSVISHSRVFDEDVEDVVLELDDKKVLRYGENPHQRAVLFRDNFDDIFEILHGKELSYNNILDIDAAFNFMYEFKDSGPACIIIKHGNPSGVALGSTNKEAYERAFATDTKSPFGGIIIFNKKLDKAAAEEVDKIFTEIILAPDYDDDALEFLKGKKNRRLLKFDWDRDDFEVRKVAGGILYQEKDSKAVTKDELKTVTEKKPTDDEIDDMLFAFKVVKHTKSNAVVFVKNKQTLAIGCGQPSRIDSTNIAIMKSKEFGHDLHGSVAASDAFFPFPDGLEALADAGATAVIQPGGSVKDEDVIAAANSKGIAMVFTGVRHFKH